MRDGYIKVAAVTPKIRVADPVYNGELLREQMTETAGKGAKIIVFPELCITGYTCGDLFWQEELLERARKELAAITRHSRHLDAVFFVGLPYEIGGKLYNMAAAVNRGVILGMVPKTFIPGYNEFYETRHFSSGEGLIGMEELNGEWVFPISADLLFPCGIVGTDEVLPAEKLVIGVELCEDLWTPEPPSIRHALEGANVIVNLSASDETTGKSLYRRQLVTGQSARLLCGYIYASAGDGESTQDVVYSGHNLIAENGVLLAESERFTNETIYSELDVARLSAERRRMGTFGEHLRRPRRPSVGYPHRMRSIFPGFPNSPGADPAQAGRPHPGFRMDQAGYPNSAGADPSQTGYPHPEFGMDQAGLPILLSAADTRITRWIDPAPFVPGDPAERKQRCDEIFMLQAMGLKKRIEHTGCQHPVVGISGGLDSALALLVMVKAFDLLGRDRAGLYAVTMPGFGTTDRTYDNACRMVRSLGATLMEVPIAEAVMQHFRDIGHDPSVQDLTYENAQARERTQILMDIANKHNGMVIGTGDMSELALGWATYNGDHMSMYAVNSSVPKTLVRHLVRYYADTCKDEELEAVLMDVLDTPVSPELLPPEDGRISQKTEDLVGPYELHDFFLYYVLRMGFAPKKIYRLAETAFRGKYESSVILKWEKVFYRRFFGQQFKRSCLPDGPKVGTVAVSPRGDLRMPSDACARIWLDELEKFQAVNGSGSSTEPFPGRQQSGE